MKTGKDNSTPPAGEDLNPLPQFGSTLKQLISNDREILKSHQNIKEHPEQYTAATDLP